MKYVMLMLLTFTKQMMLISGTTELTRALVRQSVTVPSENIITKPMYSAISAMDVKVPRRRGSLISPTYVKMEASIEPMPVI